MPLRDLVPGYETHEVAESSGLRSLVQPTVAAVYQPTAATRMSLPAAMNALKRGEIVEPTGGDGLGGMFVDAELPVKPAERPVDWSKWDRELAKAKAEIAVEAAVDHAELRHRIAAKKGISIEAAEQFMMEKNNG
jgi:hypothetical protein